MIFPQKLAAEKTNAVEVLFPVGDLLLLSGRFRIFFYFGALTFHSDISESGSLKIRTYLKTYKGA